MKQLIIESDADKRRRKKGKEVKGRAFTATLLAWSGEYMGTWQAGEYRPFWMALGGTEASNRAFMANLITGRPAEMQKDGYSRGNVRFRTLKTGGYGRHDLKLGGGMITTVYIQSMFALDPGMVEDDIDFICMPSRQWRERQQFDMKEALRLAERHEMGTSPGYYDEVVPWTEKDLRTLVPEAMLFMMYLDRRIRLPMPPNPLFGLQLMHRALREGLAHRSRDYPNSIYCEYHLEDVGIPPGLRFCSKQERIGQLISEEVAKWHG